MSYPDRLYTLQEVCQFLRCSRMTVYRLIAERKLRAFKVGASWRFRGDDLVASLETAAAPASVVRALEEGKAGPGGHRATGQAAAPGPTLDALPEEPGDNGADGRPGPQPWYLVRTRRNKERQVAAMLRGWGNDVYLPLLRGRENQGSKERPYLRSYVFVRLDAQAGDLQRVRSAPGVDQVVTIDDEPVVVPEAVLEDLQALLTAREAGTRGVELAGALRAWLIQLDQPRAAVRQDGHALAQFR